MSQQKVFLEIKSLVYVSKDRPHIWIQVILDHTWFVGNSLTLPFILGCFLNTYEYDSYHELYYLSLFDILVNFNCFYAWMCVCLVIFVVSLLCITGFDRLFKSSIFCEYGMKRKFNYMMYTVIVLNNIFN